MAKLAEQANNARDEPSRGRLITLATHAPGGGARDTPESKRRGLRRAQHCSSLPTQRFDRRGVLRRIARVRVGDVVGGAHVRAEETRRAELAFDGGEPGAARSRTLPARRRSP